MMKRQLQLTGPLSFGQVVRLLCLVNLAIAWVNMTACPSLAAEAREKPVQIVAYGDSLTAGYMLPPRQAFPDQLEARLRAKGHDVAVANAGVSGDTTSTALQRFAWAVPEGTDAVILELGANDALRGTDPAVTRRNLAEIVNRLKSRNIEVLLAGMSAPENWGKDFSDKFSALYRDLAEREGLLYYPFFLDGVALDPKLNLADGLHPTGEGVGIIVSRILPSVETLISRVTERRRAASQH